MRSGAILLATALVASLALAGCTTPTDDTPTGPLIQMGSFKFMPEDVTVVAGTTITWKNPEGTPHTVTSDDGTFGDDKDLGRGDVFTFTFDTPGVYTYHCIPHSFEKDGVRQGMVGTITVTNADGSMPEKGNETL